MRIKLPFYQAAVLVLLAGALALVVSAHAILVKSLPQPGQTVAGPTVPVALTFNSKIDQARSVLTLEKPDRSNLKVPVEVDSSAPAKLGAKLSNLAAGAYKLKWQVLAVDGHITRGEISFQVK